MGQGGKGSKYIDQDHKREVLCPVGAGDEDVIYQKIKKAAILLCADQETGAANNEK